MKPSSTAERLKTVMQERHLKQVDILSLAKPYCEKLGVKLARNDLSQYVSGKVIPRQEKITVLSLALDLSEAWLMGYDVPRERIFMSSQKSEPATGQGDGFDARDELFRKLSPEKQKMALEYMEFLAEKEEAGK